MGRYYRSKKAGKGRGWFRRNLGRAGSALKKRYTSRGKLSLAKVASDARYALSIATTARGLLNTEKKRYEYNTYNAAIGQVNANLSNGSSWELTPNVSQGTGFGNRIGSSISLRSGCIKLQLMPQSAATNPIKVDFYLVQTSNGDAFDVSQMFQYNKYLFALNGVAVYDSHSQRDPDYFSEYKVLRRKTVYLPVKINSLENRDATIKFNFGKYGKHIRFNDNNNTSVGTRIYLVALASCGNTSQTTASTFQGIQATAANTGCLMQLDSVMYFIDN